MNVGYPTDAGSSPAGEGVGYARSSEDTRKGKSGRSEGALLQVRFRFENIGLQC